MTDPEARADLAAQRIDEWGSHLLRLAAGSITGIEETSFLGRELRAAAVVATMGEVESLLRDMLVAIGLHINSEGIRTSDLIPPLRSLSSHSSFESLVNARDSERVWSRRLEVTQLESSSVIAVLPLEMTRGPQPPLDGRTIQSRHFSLVWSVLGIPNPIPSASIVASLKKLTQIRNDVAHRNIEISQVFSEAGRTATDLQKYLDDVVLLLLHVGVEWADYIRTRAYLV